VESCKFALVGTTGRLKHIYTPSAQAESTIILITSTRPTMDTLATTHIMRMDRSDRECLVLATFVTAPTSQKVIG
jgi:hypothetical protein